MREPAEVRKLNELLRAELGANPRYSWRWSEDLLHVMDVVDSDGKPVYVESRSPEGLVTMTPKTMLRKLLPFHADCWVVCALVEVNAKDGSITGTGNGAWVPLSSANSGPVHTHEAPTLAFTQYVIEAVRESRAKTAREHTEDAEEAIAKAERSRWQRCYDKIREEATAFASVPGRKGHVSFGGYESPLIQ